MSVIGSLRATLVPERLLRDFTDGRGGKSIAQLQALGELELGDAPLGEQEPVQLLQGQRRARSHDHAGAGPLAEHGVGHGHHRHVEDGGVTQDEVLDLLGADLLTAPVDQILLAALHDQVAAGMAAAPDPGAIEAVGGEGRAVVLLGSIVAADRVGPTAQQLAHLAVGDVVALLVHDADLVVGRHRASLGSDHDLLGIAAARVAEQALRHPEDLGQHRARSRPAPAAPARG